MGKKYKFSYKSSYIFKLFSIGFVALFFLPLFILLYILFYLVSNYTRQSVLIPFSKVQLELIILILTSGALLFFANIRRIFEKLFILSTQAKELTSGGVDKGFIANLAREKGEVASLAGTFQEIINKLENDIKTLEKAKKRLHKVLEKVGRFLISIDDFDSLVYLVLEATVDALQAEGGIVFSGDDAEKFAIRSRVGLVNINDGLLKKIASPLLEEAQLRKKMFIYNLSEVEKVDLSLLCAPLVLRESFWGVMCLGRRKDAQDFSEDEKKIVSNLSAQIAIAFESAALTQDRERTYFETIAALAMAVEAKDTYSRGHSERVGKYALVIGKSIGLKEEELNILYDAARLHDIGKIGISDSILNKPGRLSVEERKIIEKHPEIGEKIVQPLKTFRRLLPLIRHHHEFLDGSGYPDGLRGEEIPLAVRILTVADIYDALTTDRPYRKALGWEEVKKELQEMINRGKIDKVITEVVIDLVEKGNFKAGE